MSLDLDGLRTRHPLLPDARANDLAENAAQALQRRHAPGVVMTILAEATEATAELSWRPRATTASKQLDAMRVTEDGAEAIALTLVHELEGWTILRRLRRGEHGDWLLERDTTKVRMALEVSGTDEGNAEQRVKEKLDQVAKASASLKRTACVVRFVEPRALINEVKT